MAQKMVEGWKVKADVFTSHKLSSSGVGYSDKNRARDTLRAAMEEKMGQTFIQEFAVEYECRTEAVEAVLCHNVSFEFHGVEKFNQAIQDAERYLDKLNCTYNITSVSACDMIVGSDEEEVASVEEPATT